MNSFNRRQFIKSSATVSGSIFLPSFAIAKSNNSANSTLNIALIGSGGIAKTCFRDCGRENVIAIAEVDQVTGALGFEQFPKAKRYKDFRKMLDAHGKELDLVIVSTPDHTHFAATYAPCLQGLRPGEHLFLDGVHGQHIHPRRKRFHQRSRAEPTVSQDPPYPEG